ncbi:MAG: Wzz/FepE/Etk N-terminal domain-containing protein, partial [Nitrospirota bacterium]|nr:Wzz/FepE/Etk N-terminal domain-containing protein [Nitrospirota bacterium]
MEEKRTEIEDEINLLDYLIVILKRKKLIFSMTLSFAFVVGILVFILPNKYVAEARFLPPQDTTSSIASAMLGQLGGLSSVAGSALGLKSPNDMYIGLLNSRTVLDRIIDRFDLMKRYNKNLVFPFYREDAREKLVEDVLVATNDANSGLVTVSV